MEFASCIDLFVDILLGFKVNGRESWLITMVSQHKIDYCTEKPLNWIASIPLRKMLLFTLTRRIPTPFRIGVRRRRYWDN